MLCYRYLSRKWGMEALKTGKFKMSRVRETNDMFDCTGVFSGYFSDESFMQVVYPVLTVAAKRKLRNIKRNYSAETYRFVVHGLIDEWRLMLTDDTFNRRRPVCDELVILCMSEERKLMDERALLDESLMWAHYGDKGYGIRIGLKVPTPDQRLVVRVEYKNKVPDYDLSKLQRKWKQGEREDFWLRFIERRMMTKSAAWAYEHEIRFVRHVKDPDLEKINDHYFISIPKHHIARVDFGSRCFKSDFAFYRYVRKLRDAGYTDTKFYLARLNPNTYGYEYKSEEYIRRSVLCARCYHLRDSSFNGVGPFFRWLGNDVARPTGAALARTFEDIIGDMTQDDFELWYDTFHDMTRKNASPSFHMQMLGVLNRLSLSHNDKFALQSEVVPLN